MIDTLVRDLQILWKADRLISRIWAGAVARQFSLLVFAGLIAVFGLGMANLAGMYALQTSLGPIWAATVVAGADFAIAIIVALISRNTRPGREVELCYDLRNMALASIRDEARDTRLAIQSVGQEVRSAREMVSAFTQNPLDMAAQKLLVPGLLSLIRGLRARQEKHDG